MMVTPVLNKYNNIRSGREKIFINISRKSIKKDVIIAPSFKDFLNDLHLEQTEQM